MSDEIIYRVVILFSFIIVPFVLVPLYELYTTRTTFERTINFNSKIIDVYVCINKVFYYDNDLPIDIIQHYVDDNITDELFTALSNGSTISYTVDDKVKVTLKPY
jgi:hypothetical protein